MCHLPFLCFLAWVGTFPGQALTQNMSFPQEASEVAGLAAIRQFGLLNVMIPEVTKLRQEYFDALASARSPLCTPFLTRDVFTVALDPAFQACANCVQQRCLERARLICTTNRYWDAKWQIEMFVTKQLPGIIFKEEGVDLAADEALRAFDAFVKNFDFPKRRRKRSTRRKEPFCREIRHNRTACAVYMNECNCPRECNTTDLVLEAKQRFENAVPGFLTGYRVLMFVLDLTTFSEDAGGFTRSLARVELAGQTFEFFVGQSTLPYEPEITGTLLANLTLAEYYKTDVTAPSPTTEVPLTADLL